MNFVLAVAYHFCQNLPATYSQPGIGSVVLLHFAESTIKTEDVEGVESVSDAAPYGRGTWDWDWDLSRLALGSSAEILVKWRTASGTWFGETSRQSQADPVKQQHTGKSPPHRDPITDIAAEKSTLDVTAGECQNSKV